MIQHVLAQAAPSSQAPQPSSTTAPITLSGTDALWFAGIVGLAIALLAVVPVMLDARRANAWRRSVIGLMRPAHTQAENLALLRAAREPRGVRGLTRSLIALLIIALAGLALAVAMVSGSTDSSDLRKTIVTSLTTVLATLAGFYFGSRTAQNATDDARDPGTPDPPAGQLPRLTALTPATGAAGDTIEITGTDLAGADQVLFGDLPAADLTPVDGGVRVTVPAGPAPGTTVGVAIRTPAGSTPPPLITFTYAEPPEPPAGPDPAPAAETVGHSSGTTTDPDHGGTPA